MKEFQKYEIKIKKEDGVQSLVIEKPTFVIGRSVGADVSLKHELVSREHLRVTVKGEDFFIEDLGSSNGTWVDGVKLEAKKSLICNSSSVIIIGKSLGPTISINCFFKEKSQVLNEDVTLINAANVVSLQPKVAKVQSYAEIEMPKVANGYSYATPSARPQKLQEEPSALIIQMKNLLESEVEKAKRLAISEAEEIIAQAKYEAEKIRFDANEAAGNVTARANLEIERIKASNLKDSNTLLAGAKRESEDMLQTAAAEVSNLRANAQKFSDDLLDKAREKSKQLIEDTERNVKEKLSECKAVEEEKIHNVQELKATYTDLKSKVDTLKMIEKNTQLNYESLTKTMRLDEERMFNERTNLESLRAELSMAKKESEQRVAELKLEERNIKAQIETTILESKLQVTQGQTEIKHIEVVKATLSHEMVSIKNEKEKVALQISELESRYREESQRIRDIEASRERAQNELNKAKEEEKQVTLEVEKK